MGDIGVGWVETKLEELRPTQMTLGYEEVAFKRRIWRAQTSDARSRFICEHPFPAVVGPKGEYYILDGHHLGRALFDEGVDKVRLSLIDDFSHLDPGMFWQVMERRNLIYPYDQGRRRDFEDMPKSLRDLLDDPFRSLAAQVRRFVNMEKIRRPSSNSSGRIIFATISRFQRSKPIQSARSNMRESCCRNVHQHMAAERAPAQYLPA